MYYNYEWINECYDMLWYVMFDEKLWYVQYVIICAVKKKNFCVFFKDGMGYYTNNVKKKKGFNEIIFFNRTELKEW